MKKEVNLVYFCDTLNLVWSEEINSRLNNMLKDLNLKIGKAFEYEIEGNFETAQSIKVVERPIFFNDEKDLRITFNSNRIDFRFSVKNELKIVENIKKYSELLEKIATEFNLKILRLGLNYEKILENIQFMNLKKYYLPIEQEKVIDFEIRQNYQEILKNEVEEVKVNFVTIIGVFNKINHFLIDINTVDSEKEISLNLRRKFFEELASKIEILSSKVINITKGE